MNLGIQGRTAVVTGAGRGIGASICQILAQEGCRVVGISRTAAALQSTFAALPRVGGSAHLTIEANLEKVDAVPPLLVELAARGIEPDIIVNNAGGNMSFTDPLAPSSVWREVFQFNLEVAIDINRAFIPGMQARKWGRICHISSISALENQGHPAYCAAKAALNAYVRSVGRFVSPDNVILTSVMPGAIMTEGGYWDVASRERPKHVEQYLKDRMAIRRFGRPEEISSLVAFCCSDWASFCVGSAFLADGGQGRVFQ
jgi:3-oxoacyl-[acyl-carrier protein] reductase